MSFLARASLRAAARRPVAIRRFATEAAETPLPTAAQSSFIANLEAVEHHAAETADLWRKISYYVCAPAMILTTAWVYNVETEHKLHEEHLKEEHGGHLPEVPDYPYFNRRLKPFPWGPNSLFFNPHTQKDLSEA